MPDRTGYAWFGSVSVIVHEADAPRAVVELVDSEPLAARDVDLLTMHVEA